MRVSAIPYIYYILIYLQNWGRLIGALTLENKMQDILCAERKGVPDVRPLKLEKSNHLADTFFFFFFLQILPQFSIYSLASRSTFNSIYANPNQKS